MVYRAGHSLERCQGYQWGAAHILPIPSKATRKAVVAPPLHLPMKAQTHRYTGVSNAETHPYTGVSDAETHPYTGVFSIEALPKDVQILLHNLGGRPSKHIWRHKKTSVNPCHNDYDPWCIGARSHSFAQEATCHS